MNESLNDSCEKNGVIDHDRCEYWHFPDYESLTPGPDYVELVITRVFVAIVLAIGMFGIIMTVTVLSRKKTLTSTNCYLTALAVTDLIFLVIVATRLFDNVVNAYGNGPELRFHVYVAFVAPVLDALCTSSTWLTVTVTIERYIAICRPLQTSLTCGVKGSRFVIISIVVVAALLRVPTYFEMKIEHTVDYPDDPLVPHVQPTELTENLVYLMTYKIIVDVMIMTAVPFLLLFVFNFLIVVEVRRSTRYLKLRLSTGSCIRRMLSTEQLQLTLILGGIVIAFFICQAPYVVHVTLSQFNMFKRMVKPEVDFQVQQVTLLLICLKSSVNYALYCWFSEKFRLTFKRLFCMRTCLPRFGARSDSDTNITNVTNVTNVTNINTVAIACRETPF